MAEGTEAEPRRPTIAWTIAMVAIIMAAVFAYAALCSAIGIERPNGGFLFLFYWAGMKGAALDELAPSLIGALGGLGLAYGVMTLPGEMGPAGYAIIGAAILGCIFMMIRGHAPLIINNGFMLFLTVFTIPVTSAPKEFVQVAAAVAVAAILAVMLTMAAKALSAARGRRPLKAG